MACFKPLTGNIYHPITGERIGYRNPTTGVFTGVGSWELVSDNLCPDSPLIIDKDSNHVVYSYGVLTDGDLI